MWRRSPPIKWLPLQRGVCTQESGVQFFNRDILLFFKSPPTSHLLLLWLFWRRERLWTCVGHATMQRMQESKASGVQVSLSLYSYIACIEVLNNVNDYIISFQRGNRGWGYLEQQALSKSTNRPTNRLTLQNPCRVTGNKEFLHSGLSRKNHKNWHCLPSDHEVTTLEARSSFLEPWPFFIWWKSGYSLCCPSFIEAYPGTTCGCIL